MSRKDDPVLNVKFVQLVEEHPCLWNSTLPAYSKKDEIYKAWQAVANETHDTVRNCRERWRTIRSSFQRSLKMSRTTTGRGKRKYYLSKYLQFLVPYTRTRLKNGAIHAPQATHAAHAAHADSATGNGTPNASNHVITVRKTTALTSQPPPLSLMTRIHHHNLQASCDAADACTATATRTGTLGGNSSDDTKDSTSSDIVTAIPADTVHTSPHHHNSLLATIKTEKDSDAIEHANRMTATPTDSAGGGVYGRAGYENGAAAAVGAGAGTGDPSSFTVKAPAAMPSASVGPIDLTEFAEWIKMKHHPTGEHRQHRSCAASPMPDADQSFLNSLHPYLSEMSGKQNRRFRQKVVALIDAILDNADG